MSGDRGHTAIACTAQTSEWEDILIKKGIFEKDEILRGKGIDAEELRQHEEKKLAEEQELERLKDLTVRDQLANATLQELDEAEDDFFDDEDESMLQEYRAKRLAELKETASKAVFGRVYEISKADWIMEVNEASKNAWVVVHLYQGGLVECSVMDRAMSTLANQFKAVKFLRIKSTHAVENWPDRNCPALFLYHGGEMSTQLIRNDSLGGEDMTADDLEWYLATHGVLETELEENPRVKRTKAQLMRAREASEDD